MIVVRKLTGEVIILGTAQEDLLANILRFAIAESEVYSEPEMMIRVKNLKEALGV